MGWSVGDLVAILPANDGDLKILQHLGIAASMVAVVMSIDDGFELGLAIVGQGFQDWEHLWWIGGVNDHCFLGAAVGDDVGIIVAGANPHGDALDLHGCGRICGERCLESDCLGKLPGVRTEMAESKAHEDDEKESEDGFYRGHLRILRAYADCKL